MKAKYDRMNSLFACAFAALGLLLLPGCTGCTSSTTAPAPSATRSAVGVAQRSEDFFRFAIDNVNHLEDNDATELLSASMHRLDEVGGQVAANPDASGHGDPLAASWIEPDMLHQIVERLNDWSDIQKPSIDWQVDPAVKALDKRYGALPMLADLDQARFSQYDGFMLMETTWLRDVSNWARGDKADELDQACRLFDWTVRNIQLDAESTQRLPLFPWEVLLIGKGTASERAWVCLLLLRQQGIEAGIVALPNATGNEDAGTTRIRPWCLGVWIGPPNSGKLYLFDPQLGVPIPAAHGIHADKQGHLLVTPATLDEVRKDPKILEQIDDFDANHPYWAKKADFARASILVEASPQYLSKRMKIIESRLAGKERLVLSTAPTDLIKQLRSSAGVKEVALWQLPYATILHRMQAPPSAVVKRLLEFLPLVAIPQGPLYRGRILHLKGRFQTAADETKGALELYYAARPPTAALTGSEMERAKMYFNKFDQTRIEDLPPEQREAALQQSKRIAIFQARMETNWLMVGKSDASYWAGLACFECGDYDSAIDWIRVRTLSDPTFTTCPWTSGGRYNVARCLEAKGDQKAAILAYQESVFDMLSYGNKLRAAWLKKITQK